MNSIIKQDYHSEKEEISKAAKLGGGHIEDYQADIRSSFSIVHELGGHLDIAEHKEHGTSYIVNVPVYVKIDPKTVLKLESPPKVATMKTEINDVIQDDNIRVLLVEDESGIREILKDILEDNEINVDGASNGLDALNLLKEDKVYDLIFLDLRMPVMDGVEFIHKLYEMQFKQEARIYIITGGLEFSNEEKLIVKKVDGILQKPFNPDDLMDIIEQYRKSKHGKILFTALEKDII